MNFSRLVFVGIFCLFLGGCAASPGGGHVVGNPLMSSSSVKESSSGEAGCGCSQRHKDAKGKKASKSCHHDCSCEHGQCEEACGGSDSCGCRHD